jgi:RNA polymerase sigma factor (sigma-70 family)
MAAGADTTVGAGKSQFPPTAWTLVERLRNPKDPRVQAYLDRMIQAYWRPVYKYVRIAWKRSNEDAKDLTQAFFVHLLEGSLFARADPEQGNFRRLLLASLKNFLSNEARAAEAAKRGGGRKIVSLEGDPDEGAVTDPSDPQAFFESQWAQELLGRAIEKLRQQVRPEVFTAFQRFHLEDAPVKDIARDLAATVTQVAHHLQDARAALRRIVTDEVREYVQDEAELARELDTLFRGWK